MRYLGAAAAVLGAAMTFTFAPLGRTARAADHKPVVISILDRNAIVGLSSRFPGTITYSIKRYMNPPKLLEGLAEINQVTCTEIAVGAWTIITATQDCRNVKCGKVTMGTETVTIPSGVCAGKTFTFATIYYEWTAHNNQSTLPAPPNSVADTFSAMWHAPDGTTEQDTFDINVPVVRPDHETTAFKSWFDPASGAGPIGQWEQTLVPPSSDKDFDFSGEIVQEFAAAPAGPDTCWFPDSGFKPLVAVTNQPDKPNQFAIVKSPGNTYPDIVGYAPMQVSCYRQKSPFLKIFKNCGTNFGHLMGIHAPSDGPPFNPPTTWANYGSTNTGDLNALGASMTQEMVTSVRAGMTMTFPYGGVGFCPL